MFKKIFGRNDKPRVLSSPAQLKPGDIISFKQRRVLPSELQGEQFEVTAVGSYQYSADEINRELTLRGVDNKTYYVLFHEEDGESLLSFSVKLPESVVSMVFDEEEFSGLWSDGFATLAVRERPPEFVSWIADHYKQQVKEREAYYYDYDCGDSVPIHEKGEELRYHECTSNLETHHLSVEVWEGGETDVSLTVLCPMDVVDDMWPGKS